MPDELRSRFNVFALDVVVLEVRSGHVLNPRGSGVETGGPPTFSQGDCQTFANQLDKFLAKPR